MRIGMRQVLANVLVDAIPTRPIEAIAWWIWVHYMVSWAFSGKDSTMRNNPLSLRKVSMGQYIGFWPAMAYGSAIWASILVMAAGVLVMAFSR